MGRYLVLMIFLPKTCYAFRFFQSQDKGTLVVTEYSSGVDAESLAIRERANRRISVRDPPKLQSLEDFSAGFIAGAAAGKVKLKLFFLKKWGKLFRSL